MASTPDRAATLLRGVRRALRPLTWAFIALTVVTFSGPAILLGAPGAVEGLAAAFDAVSAVLVFVMAAALTAGTIILLLDPQKPTSPWRPFLLILAVALASANALRIAFGIAWPGLGPGLIEAVWFAAPLVLWAATLWPRLSRRSAPWWIRPMRWILALMPVLFLLAALGRVDFRPYFGGPVPTPVLWMFAYVPTVGVIGLAFGGFFAFEETRNAGRRDVLVSVALLLAAIALGGALAATSVGFIVSATVTWGSGYQLFTVSIPSAPLAVSFALLSGGTAAFALVVVRQWRRPAPVTGLFLVLAMVLNGIFESPVGVLGSLTALMLLWLWVRDEL